MMAAAIPASHYDPAVGDGVGSLGQGPVGAGGTSRFDGRLARAVVAV